MESLRLLSNLETRKHKLVQIILSGQPELDSKLSQPELRQLAQRISIKRYITPLTEEETYGYIRHRLEIVGNKGASLFSREATQLIWKYSGGVPRKINMVCDNAFLIGYGLRKKIIKASEVEEAIKDLSWSPFSGVIENQGVPPVENPAHPAKIKPSYSRFGLIVSLVLALCLILAVGLNLQSPRTKLQQWGDSLYLSSIGTKTTSEPNNFYQPPARAGRGHDSEITEPLETTSLDVSREKVEPDTRVVGKQISEPQKSPSNLQTGEETEGRLSSVSPEKIEPDTKAVIEQKPDSKKSAGLPSETKEEAPLPSKEPVPDERDMPAASQRKWVVAERGEYLSLIIRRTYGTYSEDILGAILRENPEIQDPDLIFVGQAVKLPELKNNP
jgi:general secretion pathway protein A